MISFPPVSHQNLLCICPFLHTCHMSRLSHSSWFDRPNNICGRVQVIKFLLMYSSFPCHLAFLRPRYLPQHPILEHPQTVFLFNVKDQVSHPYKITDKISIVYSTQVFLGFPVSISKCWDGTQDAKLPLHASHVVSPDLNLVVNPVYM